MWKKILFAVVLFINATILAEQLVTEDDDVNKQGYINYKKAEVIIINKITTKSYNKILTIGKQHNFANLSFMLNKCIIDNRENSVKEALLLTITDYSQAQKPVILFNGWLFPHNLSVNSFEHSVFEVIPVRCVSS